MILSLAGVILFLGLSFGLAAFFRYYDFPFLAGQAESISLKYREAGLPWEITDLRSTPPVKREENAANELKLAISTFDQAKFQGESSELFRLLDEGKNSEVSKRINFYRASLYHAKLASKKPRLEFGFDYDQGYDLEFPEFQYIKSFVKALCIRAVVKQLQKDSASAIDDLQTAQAISLLPSQDGDFLSIYIQFACQAEVYGAARRIAPSVSNDEATRKQIRDLLEQPLPQIDYRQRYMTHSYMILATIRNHRWGIDGDGPRLPGMRRTGLPATMISKAYAAKLMSFAIKEKPLWDKYRYDIGSLQKDRATLDDEAEAQNVASDYLNGILFPRFGSADAESKLEARRLASLWLLDALAYKARTGKFPATISEIPGHWIDPFSGKPIKFKQFADSIRIYSVGPDSKDGGGYRFSETKPTIGYDDIIIAHPPLKNGER